MRMFQPVFVGLAVLAAASLQTLAQEQTQSQTQPLGDGATTVPPAIAPALPDPGEPTRYDDELARLASILGSLHYLRNLCGEQGDDWRRRMESILIADKMEGERRARAIASFNDGYRAFASTYPSCNKQAVEAVARFQEEGARLTATMLTRYRS
jgi:uncharacterized protein (TIGR02301 family)